MIWLPVVFACTAASDCGFIYDQVQSSRNKCMAALQKMEKQLPKENFPVFKAGCLEVDLAGGKNIGSATEIRFLYTTPHPNKGE